MNNGSQDISIHSGNARFNYRVGGVVIHDQKVLLLTEDRFNFWYLPGGRANLFETSKETIQREILEELGEKPKVKRLLWTAECLYHFPTWNTNHHELAFYYLIHFDKSSPLYTTEKGLGTEEFSNEEIIFHYQWHPLETLKDLKLVPSFLQMGLNNIPKKTEHVVCNELG